MKIWERIAALEANEQAATERADKLQSDLDAATKATNKRIAQVEATIEDQLDVNGDGNGAG